MSTEKGQSQDAKETPVKSTPRRVGRPRTSAVKAKSKGGRKQIGRPKGDATIINEYKARMLASPKSRKVLDAIFNAALNDEHKNQAAAWKLVMDRVAPVAAFEKEVTKGSNTNQIKISISGVPGVQIDGQSQDDIQDAEWSPVAPEGEPDASDS